MATHQQWNERSVNQSYLRFLICRPRSHRKRWKKWHRLCRLESTMVQIDKGNQQAFSSAIVLRDCEWNLYQKCTCFNKRLPPFCVLRPIKYANYKRNPTEMHYKRWICTINNGFYWSQTHLFSYPCYFALPENLKSLHQKFKSLLVTFVGSQGTLELVWLK